MVSPGAVAQGETTLSELLRVTVVSSARQLAIAATDVRAPATNEIANLRTQLAIRFPLACNARRAKQHNRDLALRSAGIERIQHLQGAHVN